ncbi:UPF0382 membrane protein [Smittium culicis]|uniref:UPF0382 membrane protein n=1 Tax=Smittium culicis TaxID=133412 RepID=A0A1R1YL44_9FUNG|nr:UPF0382 membrane protein [Smittium culicis]
MSASFILKSAAFLGASSVGLCAFGAHGLRGMQGITERQIESWSTASRYQQFSALAMLSLYAISNSPAIRPRNLKTSAVLMFAGTLMFSGSIYCLVLNRERFRFMGPITPLGGLTLIAGWVALVL